MSKILDDLIDFIRSYVASNPNCTKSQIASATAEHFALTRQRSVFVRAEFAIRFSSAGGTTFSNCVLSLSALRKYDHLPFVVCVVRAQGVEFLLANSTFLKKVSHSSQQLRVDNVKGTFLGHDIIRVYESLENRPENFAELFDIHAQFTWEDNLARLVETTTSIVATGVRFEPSADQRKNILCAPETAALLSRNAEYEQFGDDLTRIVNENREAILDAGLIDNINLRGNTIEQIITSAGNFHSLEDVSRTLTLGTEVKVDIKTKILALSSSPKGYNVDKVLRLLSLGDIAFSFFFVGLNVESQSVVTQMVSILDKTILSATRLQYHWAGRNSRGVTQLTGNLNRIFEPTFSESVDIDGAQAFLQYLIDIKPGN